MKKENVKALNFEAVRTYFYDTHNEKKEKISEISEEQWKENIINEMKEVSSKACKELWLIFHDKDIIPATETEEEKAKGIHAHITIMNHNSRYLYPVAEELRVNVNQINRVKNKVGIMRYMTHTTDKAMNEQKYRYEIDSLYLFVNGEEVSKEETREKYTKYVVGKEAGADSKEDFLADINNRLINGEIVKGEVRALFINKFGEKQGNIIYNRNNKLIKDALAVYKEEYVNKKRETGRHLVTVYIEGGGNLGKTTLGVQLCQYESKSNGFDKTEVFESSAVGKGLTYDPFQSYDNEYATLLDEFNPEETLKFENFNKYFDQRRIVDVSSRQKNKKWVSDFCVISKSRPLDKTVEEIYRTASYEERKNKDNCYKQIQRRIPINIILEDNKIIIKKFNMKKNEYEVHKEVKGKARTKLQRKKLIEEIHKLVEEVRGSFHDEKEFNIDDII